MQNRNDPDDESTRITGTDLDNKRCLPVNHYLMFKQMLRGSMGDNYDKKIKVRINKITSIFLKFSSEVDVAPISHLNFFRYS